MLNKLRASLTTAKQLIEDGEHKKCIETLSPLYESIKNIEEIDLEWLLDYYIVLGEGYFYSGQLKEASQLFDEGVALIDKSNVGTKEAELLNNSAVLDKKLGLYEQASYKFQLSLNAIKDPYDHDIRSYIGILHNIAQLNNLLGHYSEAEKHFKEILSLAKNNPAVPEIFTMRILQSYGYLLTKIGKIPEAKALYFLTLRLRAIKFGCKSVHYCETLNSIAYLYQNYDSKTAEIIYKKTLRICEEILDKEDLRSAKTKKNLAIIEIENYRLREAQELLKEASDIMKDVSADLSVEHIKTRTLLNSVSWRVEDFLNCDTEFSEIDKWFEKKKDIFTAEYVDFLIQHSQYLLFKDKKEAFFNCVKEAITVQNNHIFNLIRGLPEEASLNVLKNLEKDNGYFISALIQFAHKKEFAEFMYQAITFRKGLVFEVSLMHRIHNMNDPLIRGTLKRYKELRNELARRLFSGIAANESDADFIQKKNDLTRACNEMEESILKLLPNEKMELRELSSKSLSDFIPIDKETYVFDFYKYRQYDFTQHQFTRDYHYCRVFIQKNDVSTVLKIKDLGEAEIIEKAIKEYRLNMYGYREEGKRHGRIATSIQDTISSCKALYGLLMNDFSTTMDERDESTAHVYICPDGEIAQLSFESLITSEDLYLIESCSVSYCNSVRDININTDRMRQTWQDAVIFADPEYDLNNEQNSQKKTDSIRYKRLENAREEAEEIIRLFEKDASKQYKLYFGKDVNKKRIKSIDSPAILHIITHGYFINDTQTFHHPLSRSGIVLSGVNACLNGQKLSEEYDDGVLSAYDAAVLNLKNNELIVLSACETALGEINVGEGVMGLRRSFAQAGSKTIIMSLWRISDEYTRQLMVQFFENIFKGQPVSTALRNAQLDMINFLYDEFGFASPVIWSGFICQGNILPLI